ncbi:MAG: hypothetical protein SGPRY_009511, partial [Prymnesium sp.]
MRLQVYHESSPAARTLLSLEEGATIEALRSAIEARVGTPPGLLFLGETGARIVSVADLRDGDSIRVVSPATGGDSHRESRAGDVGVSDGSPSIPYTLMKLLLTIAIL